AFSLPPSGMQVLVGMGDLLPRPSRSGPDLGRAFEGRANQGAALQIPGQRDVRPPTLSGGALRAFPERRNLTAIQLDASDPAAAIDCFGENDLLRRRPPGESTGRRFHVRRDVSRLSPGRGHYEQ